MKRTWLVVGILALTSLNAAWAVEHRFACRNEWRQEKAVIIEAASVDEARNLLKTDKEYRGFEQCSYLGENRIKSKKKKKASQPPSATPAE